MVDLPSRGSAEVMPTTLPDSPGMLKSIASFIDRIELGKERVGQFPMHPSELPRGAQSSFDRLSNRRDPAEGVSARLRAASEPRTGTASASSARPAPWSGSLYPLSRAGSRSAPPPNANPPKTPRAMISPPFGLLLLWGGDAGEITRASARGTTPAELHPHSAEEEIHKDCGTLSPWSPALAEVPPPSWSSGTAKRLRQLLLQALLALLGSLVVAPAHLRQPAKLVQNGCALFARFRPHVHRSLVIFADAGGKLLGPADVFQILLAQGVDDRVVDRFRYRMARFGFFAIASMSFSLRTSSKAFNRARDSTVWVRAATTRLFSSVAC